MNPVFLIVLLRLSFQRHKPNLAQKDSTHTMEHIHHHDCMANLQFFRNE